jgi:hypothetical protein
MESIKSSIIGPATQQRQPYCNSEVEEILHLVRESLRPLALIAGSLITSVFFCRIEPGAACAPYAPMSPAEVADLEREAGRSLTEEEAQQFRIRKLKKQLIDNMLESARNNSGESGKISRDFIEALVFSMLGFAIGFALGTMFCFGRHI